MKTSYIALLRGINVGGHRVKMDQLRGLFAELGFQDVSTFIASGNVLFSSDSQDEAAVRATIELHLKRELGYDVETFLRTPAELAAITEAHAGPEGGGESSASHYVIFLHAPAPQSLRTGLAELESEMDTFHFSGREVHWRIQGKMSESPLFGGDLERATRGIPTTTRNLNTLRRLVARTRG